MYFLRKNPLIHQSGEYARDRILDANQRLADSTAGMTFDPVPHTYTLHGRRLASVSDIVKIFAPFDTRAKAEQASRNPRHEHYGKSVDEIVAIWEDKRDRAAEDGTRLHAFGEACYLYLLDREDEIEEPFRERVTSQGLAAEEPKEISLARWWAEYDWSSHAIVAKETRIANPALGYAGTFDLLLYGLKDDAFHMKDYKSNADLHKWYGDMLKAPLNVLKANDIGKYTLQQTAYTIQLRNIGLKVSSNELIWLKEDCYQVERLEMRYDRLISYAIAQLKL